MPHVATGAKARGATALALNFVRARGCRHSSRLAIVCCSVARGLGPHLGGGPPRPVLRPREIGERLAHRGGMSLATALSIGGRRAAWREDEVVPRTRLRGKH